MKEKQTAIYLNHNELAKIHWALNNLHLALNLGDLVTTREPVQDAIATVVDLIEKVKEAKDEVCAKEAAEQAKLALEKSIRDNAIKANA